MVKKPLKNTLFCTINFKSNKKKYLNKSMGALNKYLDSDWLFQKHTLERLTINFYLSNWIGDCFVLQLHVKLLVSMKGTY